MTVPAAVMTRKAKPITVHQVALTVISMALLGVFVYVITIGWSYYFGPLEDRPFHPLHRELRPGGRVGIGFGLFSTALFAAIYVYPFRKKWKWLRGLTNARQVLDFHILMGLAAPFFVVLHGAFKFRGIAGMAFWIMMAVVISGIVGRYLYAQIPRSRKDAELSLKELQGLSEQLNEDLRTQQLFDADILRPLVTPVDRAQALKMPLLKALGTMLTLDLARPFRIAALRRQALTRGECFRSLGGLLASTHPDIENVVVVVRRQSWLTAKICFLDRAGQTFKLWHVVHRPFSLAFLLLAAIHIGMAFWMGFL